jgi:hypothetical protein
MNTKITITLIALLFSLPVLSAQTYTPGELRRMISSGNYPAQGSVSKETEAISFTACVSKVKGVVSSVSGQYPANVIVNTGIMYIAKVWTNDAALTLSCSNPDSRLIITIAKYL